MSAAERAIQEEAQVLKGILAATVDHIYVVGRDGRYRYVSAGGARVLGLQPEDLTGKHWRELGFPPETMVPFDAARERVLESGAAETEEVVFRTAEGEERYFEYIVAPIACDGSSPDAVVVVSRDITERRKSEQELRKTEALLNAVVDHAPACIFAKDREGRYLLANRSLAELVHREQSEFPGRTDRDFFPPEVAAEFAKDDEAIIASGQPRLYEESFLQDGALRTYLTIKFPLWNEEGEAFAACAVATEISDLKRVQQALEGSEERLRLALEAGRMGVWDWDLRGNTLQWSEDLEEIYGLAPGTFPGTPQAFFDFILPGDRELVTAVVEDAIREGSRYEVEFRIAHRDGSVHWMSGKGEVHVDGDGPHRIVGVGIDITERKQAEQNAQFLADASAVLADVVDYETTLQRVARLSVPTFADWCSVDMLDDSGDLRRLAVAHVDPTKVELAHTLYREYPRDPETPQGVWNVVRTGRPEMTSVITDELIEAAISDPELLRIIRELGLRSHLSVPLTVRGRTLGVITFIAAESGRRYTETDLRLAQDLAHRAAVAIENARLYEALRDADRRKDEFLALLGHELRNPLAPIRSALAILKMPQADAAVAGRARGAMERQIEHLVRLVDDLLDVSRIMRDQVTLRRERLDLATVLARAVETSEPVVEAEGHHLEIDLASEPLWVSGDLVRLAQVLSNLLNNAAKYTDRGGRIRLTVSRSGSEALLAVEDNGIGIPPELLPRLFDMFFQAERRTQHSQGGLGIGLSLVRRLVELHGGSVHAHSAGPGHGSRFEVRLPLLPEPKPASAPTPAPEPTGAARTLLVIDDNIDAADTLAVLLELGGHQVHVAYDGPAGLQQARQQPPTIALIDLGMPLMDGFAVAQAFRTEPQLQQVTLVALTGWGQPEDRQRTQEAGFHHHLVKPVDTEELNRLIQQL